MAYSETVQNSFTLVCSERRAFSAPIPSHSSHVCCVKDITAQAFVGKEYPKSPLVFYFWPSWLEFPYSKNIFSGKPKQCAKINAPKGNELGLTFMASCSLLLAILATFSKMAFIHLWSSYPSWSWFAWPWHRGGWAPELRDGGVRQVWAQGSRCKTDHVMWCLVEVSSGQQQISSWSEGRRLGRDRRQLSRWEKCLSGCVWWFVSTHIGQNSATVHL